MSDVTEYLDAVAPHHTRHSCKGDEGGDNAQISADDYKACFRCTLMRVAALAAPLPAEQPSNPVPLSDDDIFHLWIMRECIEAIQAGDLRGQLIAFTRSIETRIVGQQTKGGGKSAAPLTRCAAGRDGECGHAQCPQLHDGEPVRSGRHCPLDATSED